MISAESVAILSRGSWVKLFVYVFLWFTAHLGKVWVMVWFPFQANKHLALQPSYLNKQTCPSERNTLPLLGAAKTVGHVWLYSGQQNVWQQDHNHSHNTRLLHSPSQVAIGLSVGFETLPLGSSWLALITLLWLVGLKIDSYCPVPHCIMGSLDQWEFQLFFSPQWQSLCTALMAGNCLPLVLCKGLWKSLP